MHRPGGSALNSGQVGGIRASEKIAYGKWRDITTVEEFSIVANSAKTRLLSLLSNLIQNSEQSPESNHRYLLEKIRNRMMKSGAYIRNLNEINHIIEISQIELNKFFSIIHISSGRELLGAWKTLDALICQLTYLTSIQTFIVHGGGSRGSFLIISEGDEQNTSIFSPKLNKYPIKPRNLALDEKISEIFNNRYTYGELKLNTQWVKCRPIPKVNTWFENVWARYQNRKIFNKER